MASIRCGTMKLLQQSDETGALVLALIEPS
jgi:hypothetical protein